MTQEFDEKALVERAFEVRDMIAQAAKAAGRPTGDVKLVAVSKRHPAAMITALARAGFRDFGENYIQEALGKLEEINDINLVWHFIGKLQTNKVRYAAGCFDLIHTVHSQKLAQSLHKRTQALGRVQDVLLQVNIGEEEQKSGAGMDELTELALNAEELEGIRVLGLMCMPPFFDDGEKARPYFARLRELKELLEKEIGRPLPHLSMGMTGDFVQAIEEGATLVRIGTRIFGQRT